MLARSVFSEIRSLADDYLAGRDALFDQRIAAGFAATVTVICLPTISSVLPTGPRSIVSRPRRPSPR